MGIWLAAVLAGILVNMESGSFPGVWHSWLRAPDATITAALRVGMADSATFRSVAWQVRLAGGIVYFVRQPSLAGRLSAALRLEVHGAAGARYLRVLVHPLLEGKELTATLAHELQHAVELLNSGNVESTTACEAAFARIGFRSGRGMVETRAAIAVGQQVLKELRSAKDRCSADTCGTNRDLNSADRGGSEKGTVTLNRF